VTLVAKADVIAIPERKQRLIWTNWPLHSVTAFLFLFLAVFFLVPLLSVITTAFMQKGTSSFTLLNFYDFFQNDLFRRSLQNSLYASFMAVLCASVFSIPLAYITTRFEFRGAVLIQTLGVLPLIMPPFAGAIAMQLLFGRTGTINLLLDDWFGINIPFMEGLNGVILVQSVHYFPFILLNLVASLRNIDRSMEEAAQNLGCRGLRLFRRIIFPLAMPGYIAGASLVFIKVFDDLATPLLLNVQDMLAPQAYLRITSMGIADPMGYVIAVVLIVFSVMSLWVASLVTKGKDYSTVQRGGGGLSKRKMTKFDTVLAYAVILFILAIVLAPHVGLLLLSFATVWSFAPLPDAYTISHYRVVFDESSQLITNTLLYATIAGVIGVTVGTAIAYLSQRTKAIGRRTLDYIAMAPLAVPGVVLGIGYLRTFYDIQLPSGTSLAAFWVMLGIALGIRRLPYAMRACSAALQQVSVSLEEAAENVGVGKPKAIRRIVVPLMAGGIVAGFVTSFATAAVELSATMMLVQSTENAPLSYGLYVFMQSPAGRGPGAALGVIAVIIVGVCAYLSHVYLARRNASQPL